MKENLECVNNIELAETEKEKTQKQKEKKKEKQKEKQKQRDKQTDKQTDKQKDKPTDKQTDKQPLKQPEGKAKNDDLSPNDESGAPKKCEPAKNGKPGNKGTKLKNKKNVHKESRTNGGDEDDGDDDNERNSGSNSANSSGSNRGSNEVGRCELIEKSNTFTVVGKGKREPKSRSDDGKESKGSSTCGGATPSGTGSGTGSGIGSGTGSGTGSAIGSSKGVQKANAHGGKAGKKKKEMNKENQKGNNKKNAPEKKNGTTNAPNTNSNELAKDKINVHKKGAKETNGNENGIHSNSVAEGKTTISSATNGENSGKKKNATEQKNKANSKKGAKKNKQKNENYLQNTWVFLFDKENRKYYEQYVNGLVSLETFNTIEKFYKNYKYMKSPSSIKEYYNIYLFKHNYKPIYEEYSNGFICIIKNDHCFRDNVADLIWEKMVSPGRSLLPVFHRQAFYTFEFARKRHKNKSFKVVLLAIGEEFNLVDLSGIQLCIRENEIFFKIWMKNYSNYIKNILTKRVNELLDLPPNTSIITKILSNVYYNRKNANLKDKNEKGKKPYNKNNKPVEYPPSRKDFFKLKNYGAVLAPPNYGIGRGCGRASVDLQV
ncbi:hypothetical protein PVIIG_04643 [Plasmodium vivax India VII]|uniref:Uncharacterized protein n=1 Tax=Plasmodium vivax India VII TaxID=1077284 RepID=A0A0J9SLT3_PLAVI|nr:hypothetical protein PVIIG_04643 [Plasmodium vivax India VII]